MLRTSSENLSLWQIVKKLKGIEDREVELVFNQMSPLLENLLAFKIIEAEAGLLGKSLRFIFEDVNFSYLNQALAKKPAGIDLHPSPFREEKEAGQLSLAAVDSSVVSQDDGRKKDVPAWRSILKIPGRWTQRLIYIFWIGLFLLGFGLAAYYLPRAKVSLTVESEPLVKTLELTASTSAQAVSKEQNTIPALEIFTSARRSESSPSSGRKDVGEKAVGVVNIYNKTLSPLTLPAGSLVTKGTIAGDDLRFLTKSSITVPARTPQADSPSGYIPGKGSVEIAAEKIGDGHNLPAKTIFLVAGKSTAEIIAENDDNLSGGSRREVLVVTDEDQKKLFERLSGLIKEDLRQTLLGKLVGGQIIDENSVSFEVLSKSYDKSPSEEAENLSLILEMKAKVLTVSESDLKSLVSGKLSDFVPEGYELFGDEKTVELVEAKLSGGVLNITAKGKGFIIPKIDQEGIRNRLQGKTLDEARNYLGGLTNVSSFKIEQFPNLGRLSFLPFRADSLTVETVRK